MTKYFKDSYYCRECHLIFKSKDMFDEHIIIYPKHKVKGVFIANIRTCDNRIVKIDVYEERV